MHSRSTTEEQRRKMDPTARHCFVRVPPSGTRIAWAASSKKTCSGPSAVEQNARCFDFGFLPCYQTRRNGVCAAAQHAQQYPIAPQKPPPEGRGREIIGSQAPSRGSNARQGLCGLVPVLWRNAVAARQNVSIWSAAVSAKERHCRLTVASSLLSIRKRCTGDSG